MYHLRDLSLNIVPSKYCPDVNTPLNLKVVNFRAKSFLILNLILYILTTIADISTNNIDSTITLIPKTILHTNDTINLEVVKGYNFSSGKTYQIKYLILNSRDSLLKNDSAKFTIDFKATNKTPFVERFNFASPPTLIGNGNVQYIKWTRDKRQ